MNTRIENREDTHMGKHKQAKAETHKHTVTMISKGEEMHKQTH